MKESAARLSNEVVVNVAELEPSSSCCGLNVLSVYLSVCLSVCPLSPPPPEAPCSTLGVCHFASLPSCRLPRRTFNAVGEFSMDGIKTIDRWLCPAARSDHSYDVRNQLPSRRAQQTYAHTHVTYAVSTVARDQRSQSTFIAVAGLDCVEKLTEQWVQLWPRSAWLASPPISRPDVKHSDFFIYILLVFHFYFLRSSSPAGAGSLQGWERERERDTNRLLAACSSSSSSLFL